MDFVGLVHECLIELALRAGLGSLPFLFHNHIPFRVELTENRIHQAVRLDACPKLNLIGGQVNVVTGDILPGGRIHTGGAVFSIKTVYFI